MSNVPFNCHSKLTLESTFSVLGTIAPSLWFLIHYGTHVVMKLSKLLVSDFHLFRSEFACNHLRYHLTFHCVEE
jgi:hypothetical protein